jgi:hypothetical protein
MGSIDQSAFFRRRGLIFFPPPRGLPSSSSLSHVVGCAEKGGITVLSSFAPFSALSLLGRFMVKKIPLEHDATVSYNNILLYERERRENAINPLAVVVASSAAKPVLAVIAPHRLRSS